ncbi:C-type lectin domain family 7 member A [Penaeus vannamei]|uniref:C-type lectin domain family 7 member A n=1 Tax=Penaeus vannamei TaxID=6689 RepID=UPI00387F54FF
MTRVMRILLSVAGLAAVLPVGQATPPSSRVQNVPRNPPACTLPYHNIGGHCLLIDDLLLGSWERMSTFCVDFGGTLANLYDANVLTAAIAYMDEHGLRDRCFWVGASDAADEGVWRWTDGNLVRRGTPLWGDLADEVQQPTGGTAENCGLLLFGDHHFLHDADCSEEHAVICEQVETQAVHHKSPKIDCPLPYQYIGGRCLFVNPFGTKSWGDMNAYCQNMGGHMAKLDDANLLGYVFDYLTGNEGLGDVFYWIGATDAATEGEWLWHDGTRVTMGTPFWGDAPSGNQAPDGGEDHDCAFLKPTDHFFFNDYLCEGDNTHSFGVICEY